MNFNEKEPPYKNPELVWFELSLEVIEPKKQQNNTNLFLPGKKSTCFCYELDLLIHIRTDSCIVDGKQLKFGIQKAFLELFFVNCKLPRYSWTLLPDIKDSISIKTKRSWTKAVKVGSLFSQSTLASTLSVNIELGGTQGGEEEIIYELTQAEMRGTEKNPYIEFTAEQQDRDGNKVFNGKYGKTLGNLEALAPSCEVHGKFRVDLDGICATYYDGKPILKNNLSLFLTRFSSKLSGLPDPIKEKLQTMTGELSYVKLCS
jgi:hypothetical protein